jgi:murein L,D-transpeptidase YcbB/YkuD
MKRIAIFLVVVSLLVIAFVQFMNWRKFSFDPSYDYEISKEVDTEYHNPEILKKYYESAYRVGSFAREVWFNKGLDVKFMDSTNPESQAATNTYEQMLVMTKMLEAALVNSKKLKEQGFDNQAIKYIEENKIHPSVYSYHILFNGRTFKRGDLESGIWKMQQLFNKLGKTIKVDGNFNLETEAAVKEFQAENNLFPSGVAEQETLQLLLKKISTE